MKSPWYKTTLKLPTLSFQVPHDVFSTQQIDEGTLLLLQNLPANEPHSVLEMGCGYGALGLPVAARFPHAKLQLVDRDLLAVEWAKRNAATNRILNTEIFGSLGFRNVPPGKYDWILCNVPARIGRPFIEDFLISGRARLTPKGELRVVVIRDLAPLLEEIQRERALPLVETAKGPRHSVFSMAADPIASEIPRSEPANLYARDRIEFAGLSFDRPFDLGGDDPKRLSQGLPVLLDALPRGNSLFREILCFRIGYGVLPLVSRSRWQTAQVTAVDRDLLATDSTRRNAEALGLAGPSLKVLESAHFPDAIQDHAGFDLAMGELSPSAGEKVAVAELEALYSKLTPGGQALILALDKLVREWIQPLIKAGKLPLQTLISRDGHTVLTLRKPLS